MRAPKPTDPNTVAAAQIGQNAFTSNANTVANSGTLTNPYGTQTSNIEYQDVWNPQTKAMEKIARNNVTETLSAGQQGIFDRNQASETNLAQYGMDQTEQLKQRGGTPFQYNTGDHEQWFAKNYDALNAEGNAQADEAMRSRLASQGIKAGSAEYDRQLKAQAGGQANARLQALMQSQGTGYEQSLATRNQQTNEPLAIATGTQINMPQFSAGRVGQVANTDMAGIYSNYDNQKMQRFNSKQQMLGGLFSGVGSAFALSDRRAKTNIEKIGMAGGHNIYKYDYKPGLGQPKTRQIGVMAQEVLKKVPEAVAKGVDGLFRVNYSKAFSLGA